MMAPDIHSADRPLSRSERVMEAALRHDVEEAKKAWDKAPKEIVVVRGKMMVNRHHTFQAEMLQRSYEHAVQRLEEWLTERGR